MSCFDNSFPPLIKVDSLIKGFSFGCKKNLCNEKKKNRKYSIILNDNACLPSFLV